MKLSRDKQYNEWSSVRAEFPALDDVVYLNTAGGAPISRRAADAAMQYYAEARDFGDALWDIWLERVENTRELAAKLVGLSAETTAFAPNASYAMDLAERIVGDGGGIIAITDDFPSITIPWLNRGRKLVKLPIDDAGRPRFDALSPDDLHGVSTLAIGHVHYRTGHRVDLASARDFARAHNMRFVVDATQSVGVLPLNGDGCDADILLYSVYKWPCAGYGVGVMHARNGVLDAPELPVAGWRSVEEPYGLLMDRFSRAPSARAIEAGHVPFAAIFALGEALRFLGELGGPTEIEKRILTLAGILRQEIVNCGLSPISDGSSGIISFDHPDASGIRDRMKADNIIVGGFKNLLRASVSFYNNEDDLDRFVHALKRCL